MSFDRLDEVRSIARARAVESVEYLAFHVLGHRALSPQSHAIYERVVRGERVEGHVSETFTWLFPELCERRSASRAA